MARPASRYPTDLELQMLKILWVDGPQPVSIIRDKLALSGHDIVHTSVAKILMIMLDKGYVRRRRVGREFEYVARLQAEDTEQNMLRDLIDRLFAGSPTLLVSRLLDDERLDAKEIERLRELTRERTPRRSTRRRGKQ